MNDSLFFLPVSNLTRTPARLRPANLKRAHEPKTHFGESDSKPYRGPWNNGGLQVGSYYANGANPNSNVVARFWAVEFEGDFQDDNLIINVAGDMQSYVVDNGVTLLTARQYSWHPAESRLMMVGVTSTDGKNIGSGFAGVAVLSTGGQSIAYWDTDHIERPAISTQWETPMYGLLDSGMVTRLQFGTKDKDFFFGFWNPYVPK
jgi:hypothetical protein